MDKKIRAISVAFIGSFFARILIPNYLIFSRFYLKNRTTTKPTSKSLFFNDFNARRGIATLNSNSMVSDGNSTYSNPQKGTTIGQFLHARYNERLNDIKRLTLIFSIIPEIKPVVKQMRTNVLIFILSTKTVEKIVNKIMLNVYNIVDKIKFL